MRSVTLVLLLLREISVDEDANKSKPAYLDAEHQYYHDNKLQTGMTANGKLLIKRQKRGRSRHVV